MASTAIPTGLQALQRSAFGDLVVAENTPQVQLQFPYNINEELVSTQINNAAGSVTITDNMATVSTGASANSLAAVFSRKTVRYRPGTGIMIRFTAVFSAGVANSTQLIGFGQTEDGLFFGFNGTNFGVLRRSAGATHIEKFTVTTGAVTASGNITITLDGDDKLIAVTSGDSTAEVARKIKATDFSQVGDGWKVFIGGSVIEFVSFINGVRAGSFTFTDTDTTGVVIANTTILTGVSTGETFTNQTAWSEDVMDGGGENNPSGMNLDPTTGNVYAIQFQWLGYGPIRFYVDDNEVGDFVEVHRIKYANDAVVPSIRNPSLPLCVEAINTSNTSDIIIKSSSLAGFVEGRDPPNGATHSEENTKTNITTAENAILTIHIDPVFQGAKNRAAIRPLVATVAADGNKLATFRVYINAVLGGSPSFSAHNADTSVISVDTATTTITGGDQLTSIQIAKAGNGEIDLSALNIEMEPGDSLTVTGVFATGGSGELSASVTWKEEL